MKQNASISTLTRDGERVREVNGCGAKFDGKCLNERMECIEKKLVNVNH